MRLTRGDHQLLRVVGVLLALYLALQVFTQVWLAIGAIADVLLIFVAAWALAYLLFALKRHRLAYWF